MKQLKYKINSFLFFFIFLSKDLQILSYNEIFAD